MTTKTSTVPSIDFSTRFNRDLAAAPREIKAAFRDALQLFRDDPHHSALRNHALTGSFSGYYSIDVTEDWRALFTETVSDKDVRVIFRLLGNHKQLYG